MYGQGHFLARASEKLTHAQTQYKRKFNKPVSVLSKFRGGEEIFLDRPPHSSATALENEDGHRKLLTTTTGPYRVIFADKKTFTIDPDGLQGTVSIDQASSGSARTRLPVNGKPSRTASLTTVR